MCPTPPYFARMGSHVITTKFGCVEVKVHPCDGGWLPVLVGHHLVPYVPHINGCTAQSAEDALTQMAAAIDRLEAY